MKEYLSSLTLAKPVQIGRSVMSEQMSFPQMGEAFRDGAVVHLRLVNGDEYRFFGWVSAKVAAPEVQAELAKRDDAERPSVSDLAKRKIKVAETER